MTMNLFADAAENKVPLALAPGAVLLREFVTVDDNDVVSVVNAIAEAAPFRHLITPGGSRMSVAMTNCGEQGWISDRKSYRYEALDPDSGKPWPPMPDLLKHLAQAAAKTAGFPGFKPDACLINQYQLGNRLTLHQDKDELDLTQPIVSVSLGVAATFLFGGLTRAEKPLHVPLTHGDVVVWGGPARMRYHGVLPLKAGHHPSFGHQRINLTFRKAV